MRNAFSETLLELAEKDKNICLLVGDLGFSVFEKFEEKFPDRYINCGIAEQNMMGMATGLALNGKCVFVYSITPFVTMRCFEQIRNDVCLHNANVKIVGVGSGFSYGELGPTHHSVGDLAIMRALPNMTVMCPADPVESKLVTMSAAGVTTPVYISLGKGKESIIHTDPIRGFAIGKANFVKEGRDITIIGIGSMVQEIISASEILKEQLGISVRVISMTTLKPLDKNIILKAAEETKMIFTVEENTGIGALGDAVASELAQLNNCNITFKKISANDCFEKIVGNQKFIRESNGLSPEKLVQTIISLWKSKTSTN